MGKRYIITLMAANRVGILAAVTNALDELGGNLREVSQTVMQKFFTIIMAAEFPEHRTPDVIVDHIRDIGRPFGIEVNLKDPDAETLQTPVEGSEKFVLILTGQDRPGIIRQITHRLAHEGIDIVDLYAMRHEKDGTFTSLMELDVPSGVDALALQQDLERMGREVGLAATMQHENIFIATNDPRPVRVSLRERAESRGLRGETT